jgi:excisionase family DNA binding protein
MKTANEIQEPTNYLSLTDMVRLTGIRESKIRYYIQKGKLKATKIGWQWFIEKSSVDEFVKSFEKSE